MVGSASEEMERVLGTKPVNTSTDKGWAVLQAHRWDHAALHGDTASMDEHVVMGYLDTPRRIERAIGKVTLRSVTANHTVTIIPAGQSAHWDIYGDLSVVHLYIPGERLQRVADDTGSGAAGLTLIDAVGRPDDTLARLLRLLAVELDREVADTLYADTLSELICIHLLRAHAAANGAMPAGGELAHCNPCLAPWQIARVKDYIAANLGRSFGLRELSELVDLSPKYFCTAFRKATGLPPHAWAQHLRVERAKALLIEGRLGLIEIAFDLGYASQSAFGTAFKRATGYTPGEWRRGGP